MLPEGHGGNYIHFDILTPGVPAPILRRINKITIEGNPIVDLGTVT